MVEASTTYLERRFQEHREVCWKKQVPEVINLQDRSPEVGVCLGREEVAVENHGRTEQRPSPEDLMPRDFATRAPNRIWGGDLTYVASGSGFVYVVFVIDVIEVFSR